MHTCNLYFVGCEIYFTYQGKRENGTESEQLLREGEGVRRKCGG